MAPAWPPLRTRWRGQPTRTSRCCSRPAAAPCAAVAPPAERGAALDWLDAELARAARGRATHPLLVELTPTLRKCELPLEPFRRLIEANRRDQIVTRYPTFDDVLGYCALSANPIGELVLRVMDAATPERLALSDRVCTGLQLVEH